jgi:hypothetical protein
LFGVFSFVSFLGSFSFLHSNSSYPTFTDIPLGRNTSLHLPLQCIKWKWRRGNVFVFIERVLVLVKSLFAWLYLNGL